MSISTEELEKLLSEATKGAWSWSVNRQSHLVELSGGDGDLTVMSFGRWGMRGASPIFWFWKGNVSDEPQRADKLAKPALDREHHFHWHAEIDHPDARLISLAPDLARRVIAAEKLVEALRGMADVAGDIPGDWSDDHQVVTCAGHFRMARAALSEWEACHG